ncbi:protein of unknown function [Paraburkholderia dioscoreae]|uniref:Uncharacterized protein n=1 Tax=Paraburkholderia dioscoreae TaxID=2604047 RepID=A0A5Q4YUQ0_9BURK|nr:protein of unknown function [Paraburkholderia dioscoreae]
MTACGINRTPAQAGRATTSARLYFNGRALVGEPQGSPVCLCPGLSYMDAPSLHSRHSVIVSR